LWIATNAGNLNSEFQSNSFIVVGSSIRCGILMLLQRGDFWVDCLNAGAKIALGSNTLSVPFKGTEDQSGNHAINRPGSLSICECPVSCSLLQALDVGDITLALSGSLN
jgi:hypothetical protein